MASTVGYKHLTINGLDLTHLASELKISEKENYITHTSAKGNTYIDKVSTKHIFEISFPSLDWKDVEKILYHLSAGGVNLEIRNAYRAHQMLGDFTGTYKCYCDTREVEYMYIHSEFKARFKPFTISCFEL